MSLDRARTVLGPDAPLAAGPNQTFSPSPKRRRFPLQGVNSFDVAHFARGAVDDGSALTRLAASDCYSEAR